MNISALAWVTASLSYSPHAMPDKLRFKHMPSVLLYFQLCKTLATFISLNSF